VLTRHEIEVILPQVHQSVEHELAAVGLTPASPSWAFHWATFFEDDDGIRGADILIVEPSVGTRYEPARFDWQDADRGYRLEILTRRLDTLRLPAPSTV